MDILTYIEERMRDAASPLGTPPGFKIAALIAILIAILVLFVQPHLG